MGGLQTVNGSKRDFPRAAGLVFAVLLGGCEDKGAPAAPPKERSQAVQATSVVATIPTPGVQTAAQPVPAAEHPILCAQQLGKPPKDPPKSPVSRAGAGSLPEKIPFGHGAWTWVNLWAAWCVPCREEMPRLRSWQAKLAGERAPLKVVFVSIDDDGRQLETFLAAQPETGTKSTYWLKDGKERAAWLKEAGWNADPELPAHVLVDPTGKVRCRQQGAIDDADYEEVVKIVRGLRGGTGAGQGGDNENGHGAAPSH